MTVTQTVDIPASHRLTIDVPREVPEGKAVVTFSPAEEKAPDQTNKALQRKEEMKLLKQALEEIRNGKAHTPLAKPLTFLGNRVMKNRLREGALHPIK